MLRRINDENKKTKEVLDKIDRGEFKKEKRVEKHQPTFAKQMFYFILFTVLNLGFEIF